jgi:NMD protein affecting ribosome stability and mRNA decay
MATRRKTCPSCGVRKATKTYGVCMTCWKETPDYVKEQSGFEYIDGRWVRTSRFHEEAE